MTGPTDGRACGLTQDMEAMDLATPPGLSLPDGIAPQAAAISTELLRELVEDEIIKHFPLVQARAACHASRGALEYPSDFMGILHLLDMLAYDLKSDSAWATLGFAMFDGPEPSAASLTSRARSAKLLCSMVKDDWDDTDKTARDEAIDRVNNALAHCLDELPYVLKERRKLKHSRLPLWKELGDMAISVIRETVGHEVQLLTQWSNLLRNTSVLPACVTTARQHSDRLERGDTKILETLAGRDILAWAPTDNNALHRILTQMMKSPPDLCPKSLYMIAPIRILPGMNDLSSTADIWAHGLMGERWIPFVRDSAFCPCPLEMVVPGNNGPMHVRQGLAVFRLAREGPRGLPAVVHCVAPILDLEAVEVVQLDLKVDGLPALMLLFNTADLDGWTCRSPSRSLGSTNEIKRIKVEVIPPPNLSDLEVLGKLRRLRAKHLSADTFFGHRSLVRDQDAMIADFLSPHAAARLWTLSSQLLYLSSDNALLISDASEETWVTMMDRLLVDSPDDAIIRLKWKPSRLGGRPFAVPSALQTSLSAARRRKGVKTRGPTLVDHITEVTILGEVGRDDKEVLHKLVSHLCSSTGLRLSPAANPMEPKIGEWLRLADREAAAPPGKIRIYLPNADSVHRVYAALHNQLIRVGLDTIAIGVFNDALLVNLSRGKWPGGAA